MFTTVKMFLLSNAYKLLGFSIKKIMPIIYALAMYTHNTCLKHMCTYYTYSIFIHIYYIHSTFIHTYHIHPEYMCAHILYHLQHAYTHSYLYTISYTYSTCLHTSTVHVYAHTTMRKAHVNSFVVTDLEVKADRVWVVATMLQSTLPVSGTQHPFTTVNRVSESGHLHKTYNKTSLRTFVQDLFFVNHNVLEWEYTPNTEEWFKIHQPFRRRELRPTALCPSLGSASVTFCEGGRGERQYQICHVRRQMVRKLDSNALFTLLCWWAAKAWCLHGISAFCMSICLSHSPSFLSDIK